MTKREIIAELQVRYYQLSRENKAFVLTLAGKLVTGRQPPGKGQERQEKELSQKGDEGKGETEQAGNT
jgi:hypothetical protein